jgi:ribosomal protein S18 acetylase RimI-like enzyme
VRAAAPPAWTQTALRGDETEWFSLRAAEAYCDPHETAEALSNAEITVWRHNGAPAGVMALYWQDTEVYLYILSVDPAFRRQSLATRMLHALRDQAVQRGVPRIRLFTNNVNFPALRLYQRIGFRLIALYPGRWEEERGYERVNEDGIPIRDALELAWTL